MNNLVSFLLPFFIQLQTLDQVAHLLSGLERSPISERPLVTMLKLAEPCKDEVRKHQSIHQHSPKTTQTKRAIRARRENTVSSL